MSGAPSDEMSYEADLEPVDDAQALAEQFVDSFLPRDEVLRVLDIKAGEQRFEIRRPIYVVGVDVLQAERGRRPDADEHRVMDLEDVELEQEEYDIILCVNVLEHARDPLALFASVRDALKTGGTFVAVLPNVVSLKGFLTRLTPRPVHRWFYSHILGASPESHPAPSVHSLSLRPTSLLAHARSSGWKVEYFRTYEGPVQKSVRRRFGIVGRPWQALVVLTRMLTFGFLSAEETGIVAVFTKIPI